MKNQMDPNKAPSASAVDADQHLLGESAAQAEADKIEAWTKPNFAGGGHHQARLDPSFGYSERKTGK